MVKSSNNVKQKSAKSSKSSNSVIPGIASTNLEIKKKSIVFK